MALPTVGRALPQQSATKKMPPWANPQASGSKHKGLGSIPSTKKRKRKRNIHHKSKEKERKKKNTKCKRQLEG